MKTFKHRKDSSYLMIFFTILLVIMSSYFIILMLVEKTIPLLLLFSVILFAEGIVLFLYSWGIHTSKISLTESMITLKNYKNDVSIKYDEITQIEIKQIPYFNGKLKIKSSDEIITIDASLEDILIFIDSLIMKLKEAGLTHTYDSYKLDSFIRTCKYSKKNRERVYKYKLHYKFIILHILGFLLIKSLDSSISISSISFTVIIPIIVYSVFEIYYETRHYSISETIITIRDEDHLVSVLSRIYFISYLLSIVYVLI